MTDVVHVLVYGSSSAGVCDFYRLGMYRDRLAALGVEMRHLDLAAQNAALGVNLVNRQVDAVAPSGAEYRSDARQFDDVRDVDGRRALRSCNARERWQNGCPS